MAQFTATYPEHTIAGSVICALVASICDKLNEIEDILIEHQLQNPTPDAWYSMQDYVEVLQAIAKKMGPHGLFDIGKKILGQGQIPAQDLQEALQYFDSLHHTEAKGENSYYRLLSYSEDKKEAHIECRNPFPCYFDRGVLTTMFRNFQRQSIQSVHVALDNHRPNRLAGADVSYYTVLWQ